MLDTLFGVVLLLLLVLGVVRCVVAWLIYKEWQQQSEQRMETLPQISSAPLKHDSRQGARIHYLAHRPRRHERHASHSHRSYR